MTLLCRGLPLGSDHRNDSHDHGLHKTPLRVDIIVVYVQRYRFGHETHFVPPITGIHLPLRSLRLTTKSASSTNRWNGSTLTHRPT